MADVGKEGEQANVVAGEWKGDRDALCREKNVIGTGMRRVIVD